MVDKPILINDAIQQVLQSLEGAIPLEEFYRRVLAIRPSYAKDPKAAIREKLRYEWTDRLVRIGRDTIVPARYVMEGVRWAVPLNRQAIKRGLLFVFPAFEGFTGRVQQFEDIKLFDAQGHPLPTRLKSFQEKVKTAFGPTEVTHTGFDLADWFKRNKVQRGGYVFVTVVDWEQKHFGLAYEPAKARARHREEVAAKNRELADLMFAVLEASRNEDVIAANALSVAYAQMKDPHGYPGDHWLYVIEQDQRMMYDGWRIHYSDWRSPLMAMLEDVTESQSPAQTPAALSPEQAQAVYRFKAALKYRKGLWRSIEIQGGQTLADFNQVLVGAFNHDWDHLGGFWKRVRRGNSKRYREIDLGSVDPFGTGDGATVTIASLGLQPGDMLKYVFDFGDWIEHYLTLEAVVEPEEDTKYPRIVAQNRPRYRYCETCKAQGRKTVATWICIDCSNREQRDVLLCEDCLTKYHEDHYADELLY